MPRRLLTPLHFEKSRLLLRERNSELWEGTLDGKLCLARRHLGQRAHLFNDFLQLSTIRNPLVATPHFAGLSKRKYFSWLMPLEFPPANIPESWDSTLFSIQFASLVLACHKKRLGFKSDFRFLIYDEKTSQAVLCGVHWIRQISPQEAGEYLREQLERLRIFVSSTQAGSKAEKVFRKWERRKESNFNGCLEELLQLSGMPLDLLMTHFECRRHRELELVTGLYQLSARSRGRSVLFTGDPGEGKSTLLRQLYRELLKRASLITYLPAERDDRPYSLVRKLLDRFFESSGAYRYCKNELAASKWRNFLDGSSDVPEERIATTFFNVVEKLHSSERACFVFLIDDVDRCDSQSLNVLRRIVTQIASAPVLFVFTSNDSKCFIADEVVRLSMEQLAADELQSSYAIPLWKKEQSDRFLNHIYKRTSGNPLLFYEYLKETLRQGQDRIRWENGEWTLPEQLIPDLPDELSNLYLSQLPELTIAEREFLQIAAVQGSTFDTSLAESQSDTAENIARTLHEKGLIVQMNGRCHFKKAHLAEFLYREIDEERLRGYHAKLASKLLNREEKESARIAFHFLKAREFKQALQFACTAVHENRAGAVSLVLPVFEELEKDAALLSREERLKLYREKGALLHRKGLYPAASESYRRALDHVDSNVDQQFELLVDVARSHLLNNDINSAHQLLQDQAALIPRLKNRRLLLSYYLARGVCAWHRGNREEEDFDYATQIAEEFQDFDALAAGYRQRAELALRDGSLSKARLLALKVLKYCRKTANHEEMGQALRIIGSVAFRTSKYEKSERVLKRSIRILKKTEGLDSTARVWNLLGNMYLEIYRFNDAIKAFQNASSLFNQLGHPLEVSLARFNMGLIFIEQGRLNEAEKIYLRCRSIDKQAGNKLYFAYDIRALAVIAIQRGHYKKADKLLKRTIEICEELNAAGDVLQTKMILLFSMLEQKNYRDAMPLVEFVRSKLAELHNEPMSRSEIQYLLAQYHGYTGDLVEAIKQLDSAIRTASKIRHYKLMGMALILQLVFKNSVPSKNESSFKYALRYFRLSHNQLRCADSLLKLYEAYPLLLRDKEHAKHLAQGARLFRQSRNRTRYKAALKLITANSTGKTRMEPLYDWWHSLLAILGGSGDLHERLKKVLVQLSQELNASCAAIRYQNLSGEMLEADSAENNAIEVVMNFRDAIFKRLQKMREAVNLEIKQEADLLMHPAATLHDIQSVLAVPILSGGAIHGMIYFERGSHQPSFSRTEAGKAVFFATAAAPILEQAVQSELGQQRDSGTLLKSEFPDLVGKSEAMQEVYKQMARAAPVDISVLILGESGTGKELIARNLHRNSRRSSNPFLALNCSAIPETLLESELFGYARGAFTGASASRQGLIERANGGTLFLDEIGDLTQVAQVKLLRVMQEREIQRLGENITRKVDVRFIFATHKDLKKLVKEGAYRQDLFYRVSVHTLNVPPLRDRKTDIPLLVSHLTEKYCASFGKEVVRFSSSALQLLCEYSWPGNVRELENVIQSTLVNCRAGSVIDPKDLPPELSTEKNISRYSGFTLEEAKEQFEREFLIQALNLHRWNKTQTAKDLNVTRQGLMNMIQRLGIKDPG